MSHRPRRAPPIECPLASLGHNLPADHQTYHHPLSSSPLNPDVYQMSSRKSPILNISSDGLIQFSSVHETDDSNKSSEDVSQLGTSSNRNISDNNDYANCSSIYRSHLQCSFSAAEDSDSVSYHQENENDDCSGVGGSSVTHNRNDRLMNRNNRVESLTCSNNTMAMDNEEYFLEKKMQTLFVQDRVVTANKKHKYSSAKNDQFYNLYCSSSRLKTISPGFGRQPSSPSETSEKDRYLNAQTTRESSVLPSLNIPRSAYNYLSNHNRTPSSNSSILMDGLSARIGRFSPSYDQGYHTLNSPSLSSAAVHSSSQPILHSSRSRNRSETYFNKLTDELCIKIFELIDSCDLCNVSKVCKRFDSLVWRPPLWKTITLKGENINGDRALRGIVRRLSHHTRSVACPEIERVMLSDSCRLSDKGLELLSRRCPELTHLQMQASFNVSNCALFHLVTKCTNLQHLDVSGCTQITSIDFNHELDPPRRLLLQFLDLTDCFAVDDNGLKIIVQNCPQLVYLYLRRCTQISDVGLKFVPSFCTALRELSVSDCVNITDFGLYELAKLGATLRYLSVAKCDQVSDAGLKVIARRCYKLRYLNARGCEAVSDDSITMLAHSCPRLRALDIGKCDVSDTGLHALAESCPNLKKISLKNCDMITDRGIQCIAYYCRGLQHLNIQECQITIEGYRAVKMYCKRCVIEHTNPGFG